MELGSITGCPFAWPHFAEVSLEEIAEIAFSALRRRSGELETCIPVGRRLELLIRPPLPAELIASGALLRVGENLVGLANLLEPALGTGIFVDVG